MGSLTTLKPSRRSRASGQAMVEFAILMLLFVPLTLYGFYLCDAAYHQLEVQEATLSTLWDFTQRNKTVTSADPRHEAALVSGANRLMFSDHTSSFDDPNDLSGNKEDHHNQFAAHACFLPDVMKGSQPMPSSINQLETDYDKDESGQVRCAIDRGADLGWVKVPFHPATTFGNDNNFTHGGIVYCRTKAWVYNFIIPESFLQEFSHDANGDRSGLNQGKTDHQYGDSVHGIKGSGGVKANVLLRDKGALAFDTWAIENAGDVNWGQMKDNAFYKREKALYGNSTSYLPTITGASYGVAYAAMASLMSTASSKVEYIVAAPYVDIDLGNIPMPSNAGASYLVARYDRNNPGGKQRSAFNSSLGGLLDLDLWMGPSGPFESQPYSGNSKYSSAWSNRGNYYMGSKNESSPWSP